MASTLLYSESVVSAATWSQRTVPGAGPFDYYAAAMSDDGARQIVASNNGYLYTSSDSGATWTQRDSIRQWRAVDTSADGLIMYAASERVDSAGSASQGSIHKSTDGGATWTITSASRSAYYRSLATSSDGSVILASSYALVGSGNTDFIYVSTDGGTTWNTRDSKRSWQGVAVSADGTKMVAICCGQMSTGRIYRSTNSGSTFTAVGPTEDWWFVDFSDDFTYGIASTYGGKIYTTSDGGTTWTLRTSIGSVRDVAIAGDGSKWGFAQLTALYLSDNGVTYLSQNLSGAWSSLDLSSDGTKALAATYGSGGKIFGTGNIAAGSTTTTSTTTSTTTTTTTTSTTTTTTTTSTTTTVAPSSTTSSVAPSSSSTTNAPSTTAPSSVTTVASPSTTQPASSAGTSTTTTSPRIGSTSTTSSSAAPTTTVAATTTTSSPVTELTPGDEVDVVGTPEEMTPPVKEESLTNQTLVVIDGVVVDAQFSREGDTTVMTAETLSIKLSVTNADATPVAPEADGAYILEPGMKITVSSTGLRPSATVNVWMYSTPVSVGSVTSMQDGTLNETFNAPESLELGRHHFVVNSRSQDGGNVVAVFLMKVNPTPGEGVSIGRIVLVLLGVVVVIALALPPTLRRRRKTA